MSATLFPSAPLIDVEHDELIPVRTLAKRSIGRDISPACLWRWIRKGVRGVKLEAVTLMGVWHSTPAAFGAFITQQTAAAMGEAPAVDAEPAERSPEKLERLRKAGLIKN